MNDNAFGSSWNRLTVILPLVFILFVSIPQIAVGAYYTYLYVHANDDAYQTPPEERDRYSDAQSASDSGSGFSSQATASFDLYDGELKFEAYATGYDSVNKIGADTDLSIVVRDEIYPAWETPPAGGTVNSPMEITLAWEVQGSYTFSSASPYDYADVSSAFAYGVDVSPTAPTTWTWNNYLGQDRDNLTDGYEYWEQSFTFYPEFNTSILLYQTLFAQFETYAPASYFDADFWDTAWVDVRLPAGAAFTSSSTVLLTGHPIAEPATLLLLGTGLAGIAGLRRLVRY
jgi:hypothetical protein